MQRPVDLEKEGYDLIRPAYEYLVRYPLTAADLALVDDITLDGGNEIYRYCFYFWGGGTRDFDVRSVEGITNCPNRRRLNCIAMIDTLDATHLVGLKALEEIGLPQCLNPQPARIAGPEPGLERCDQRRRSLACKAACEGCECQIGLEIRRPPNP